MPKRLSIAAGMVMIAIIATGMAALRHPNRVSVNATISLAIGAVVVAVLVATGPAGTMRTFARGFAISAGTYLTLAIGPGLETRIGHDLITTPLIDFAYERTNLKPGMRPWNFRAPSDQSFLPSMRSRVVYGAPYEYWCGDTLRPDFDGAEAVVLVEARSFFQVAHSLIGVLLGIAGGVFCLGLARTSRDRNRPSSTPATLP